MLTPYEFGKETGRLHGQLDGSIIDEERAKHLADVLGIEEKTEFMEGYRNGFIEGKEAEANGKHFPTPQEIYEKQTIPNPSWGLTEDELAEAEREMLELDASLQAGKEMIEDETRALKAEMTNGAYFM